MNQFITNHRDRIAGVLSGWDRVRFRGTIRMLATVGGVVTWMMERLGHGYLKEFKSFAELVTSELQASVEKVAAAGGHSIRYLAASSLSKEDLVKELLAREGMTDGLVCVLSCVEPCRSFEVRSDRKAKSIDLFPALRKCLHWYLYYLDSTLGLCHVRIQSWLPFAVHICINGREWLCRQLTAAGIDFTRRDNCLIDTADFETAQRLLTVQRNANWNRILNRLLYRACPAFTRWRIQQRPFEFYWSADETEWATDLSFQSSQELAALYPSLVRHSISTFSSENVMRYLGKIKVTEKGIHPRFQGEVVSTLRYRPEGVRVKHQVNGNSIKMYDKQGFNLRIETTINNPRDMKVFRTSEANSTGPKSWRYLRKGVVDLRRRAEVSNAANLRYLTALGAVESPKPLGSLVDSLSQPIINNGRRVRGLNPISGEDAQFAQILLRGEFTIHGFRNGDLRKLRYPSADPKEHKRLAAKITRLLRMFRCHGLIYKIQKTNRYQLTASGRQILPAFLAARNANAQQLNKIPA